MKVYILTRFSIFDTSYKGFKINCNNYKEKLFSKKRLDTKFTFFEKMTLPSILNQTYKDWEWHIFTSKELPNNYKTKLKLLTSSHRSIKIFYINSFKEFIFDTPSNNISFCTIRLDDDDGLHSSFFKNIQKYKEKKHYVVSHINGIYFTINSEKIQYGNKRDFSNIALGLCGIGFNIYKAGNHNSIHKHYNIIYDKTPNMWYLAYGKYCDSGRNKIPGRFKNVSNNSNISNNSKFFTLHLEKPYYKNLKVLNKTLGITKEDEFYKDKKQLELEVEIIENNKIIQKTLKIIENTKITIKNINSVKKALYGISNNKINITNTIIKMLTK